MTRAQRRFLDSGVVWATGTIITALTNDSAMRVVGAFILLLGIVGQWRAARTIREERSEVADV